MSALGNLWRRALWRAKLFIGINTPTWPVLYSAPKLNSTPSASFVQTLTHEQRARLDTVVQQIKVLSCWYNYFPTRLNDDDWCKLLRCSTARQRLDHLKFIRKKEELAVKDKNRHSHRHRQTQDSSDPPPLYLPAARLKRMDEQIQAVRYLNATLLHPQPALVIDCQFLDLLSPRGLNLTLLQIQFLLSQNRARHQPWPIHLCNLDLTDPLVYRQHSLHLQMLHSRLPSAQVSSASFVEMFPNSNLVYLSPHAEQELDSMSGSEVFILGGIVDRAHEPRLPKQASLLAAQHSAIPSRKLPIDTHIKWKTGSKYLTLTAVASILYDVYEGQDWTTVLNKNLPVRNTRAPRSNTTARYRRQRLHLYEQQVLQRVITTS